MTRHKTSLSADYVKDWGVQEALRELFQNCIDHGDWECTLLEKQSALILKSLGTALTTGTLLLGQSKKKDGAIGKFGEGYKLAALVLAREGVKLTIDTADEVWLPKLINSRTYGTQQLVFDTIKSKVKMTDLAFTIEGLKQEDIVLLKERNLHMTPVGVKLATKHGYVIDRPGDVFVNGLFVCNLNGYKFGYNFKPAFINIDRDRRIVRDFDLKWVTGQMWHECEDHELVLQMIKDKCPEVEYLDSFMSSMKQGLADTAATAFITEHGTDAVPVVFQADLERAKEQGHDKIVLMPKAQKELIDRSTYYHYPPPRKVKKTPREELLDFRDEFSGEWPEQILERLNDLIDKAEGWRL